MLSVPGLANRGGGAGKTGRPGTRTMGPGAVQSYVSMQISQGFWGGASPQAVPMDSWVVADWIWAVSANNQRWEAVELVSLED